MRGTWQTTGGGGGTAATAVVVLAVLGAAVYVVPRLAWIAGITAACVVLSVVLAFTVVPRLARCSDERDAVTYAAQRPAQLASKADRTAEPRAIEPPRETHLHFHVSAAELAAIMRRAEED